MTSPGLVVTQWRTKFEPMNPAPPVTSNCTGEWYRRKGAGAEAPPEPLPSQIDLRVVAHQEAGGGGAGAGAGDLGVPADERVD